MIALALLTLLGAAQDPVTTLTDVVVTGGHLDPLVSVVVETDGDERAIVRSDPAGVRCGARRYQYSAYGNPRLCWIRQPVGTEIRLTAETASARVVWSGCEVQADPRQCRLTVPRTGAAVTAAF